MGAGTSRGSQPNSGKWLLYGGLAVCVAIVPQLAMFGVAGVEKAIIGTLLTFEEGLLRLLFAIGRRVCHLRS